MYMWQPALRARHAIRKMMSMPMRQITKQCGISSIMQIRRVQSAKTATQPYPIQLHTLFITARLTVPRAISMLVLLAITATSKQSWQQTGKLREHMHNSETSHCWVNCQMERSILVHLCPLLTRESHLLWQHHFTRIQLENRADSAVIAITTQSFSSITTLTR